MTPTATTELVHYWVHDTQTTAPDLIAGLTPADTSIVVSLPIPEPTPDEDDAHHAELVEELLAWAREHDPVEQQRQRDDAWQRD